MRRKNGTTTYMEETIPFDDNLKGQKTNYIFFNDKFKYKTII